MVDGAAHLYRSFFGIKSLSTRGGTPTNAVYGFIRAIHQFQQIWNPSHLVVAWDGGTPVERLERLPSYKSQRPPMPDALREQIAPIMEYLELAAVPVIRLDRQEADDVLASLATWAAAEGADQVLIASSDKDLFQLVDDRVSLIAASKDEPKMDREAVYAKTGVYPGQIVDWLSLTGDTADNIPGVEGLGPKTAAKLLGQFGSLASLWGRLAEVEPERIRIRLEAARALVENNVRLIQLRRDLACAPGWDVLAVRPESPAKLRPYYERLEFHSLLKGLEQPSLL